MADSRSWIGRTKGEDENRKKQGNQRVVSQEPEFILHAMPFDDKPRSSQVNRAVKQECNNVIQTSPVKDDGGI